MCGICGYIDKKGVEKEVLWEMNNSMIHRGPDDGGIFQKKCLEGYFIGLGHRRLSIQDLSDAGHQPMQDESGRYTIVFNGEIYNFRELRDILINKGYEFKSNCDTEVLLKLYIEFKLEALDMLNGMYAFGIYDAEDNSFILVRDKIGEKPLYYFYTVDMFVFGSELKPIMKYPEFPLKIRKDVLKQYLVHNSIMPPNTIFEDTYKLGAGEYLIWKSGQIKREKYYNLVDKYKNIVKFKETDYQTCKRELKTKLYDSVERRLIADVSTGCFLSGGIDSTLVSAIANEIKPGGIDTFCIGFEDKNFNEAIFAKESAQYLGTHHHEMIMREKELLEMLEDLVLFYDEPFADSSQLATMLVAKYARENITVALSGDGGDEFFAGYTKNDILTNVMRLRKYSKVVRTLPHEFVEEVFKKVGKEKWNILLWDDLDDRLYQGEEYIRGNIAQNILIDHDEKSHILEFSELKNVNDLREKRMLYDMVSYLPDEVLVKTDRASMKYALEMRTPLLDQNVIEYSFRIPFEYKYYCGEKKHILKDILYDYIPKEKMERPKKGFGVPIRTWLNTILKQKLMRFADREILEKQGIFDYNGVSLLISKTERFENYRYQATLWCFFIFQLWYQNYIEDLWN